MTPTAPAQHPAVREFPPGFLWGVSTASYQIEGAVDVDGRLPSIWDTFSHTPGATLNGDHADVSCDHYHHVEEDLDLLARLGVTAYRFSVAWPRVQPHGSGPVNQVGLDFYRRVVAGLRDRDIVPLATLYHWDLPQTLEDAGGWTVRETAERFADYAGIVADGLGGEVGRWITLNEPWCSAWLGYGLGHHAPGRQDIGTAVAATHYLLLGHGLAVDAVRAAAPDAEVGISLNMSPVRPVSDHPEDVEVARLVDGNLNRLFADPLFTGAYPEDMLRHYQAETPGFSVIVDGDLDIISRPTDFLGINFYSPTEVTAISRGSAAGADGWAVPPPHRGHPAFHLGGVGVSRAGADQTLMGWVVDPSGLSELLVGLTKTYGPRPLYVTENGASYADYVGPDGHIHDHDRIDYLRRHFEAGLDAIDEGADLRGYFVWSFLDNFEWGFGYHRRFGLTWVDYPTGTRTPKDSFHWYQDVIGRHGLS